jgi:deazaflavin-dependent oxidoreductase (nitroreductase family)
MAMPRWWARANRAGLNRLTRRIAWWLPGMGLLTHDGRRSGREYRTPLIVFTRSGGYVVALTYGPEADWVRNVLASGHARLHTRRRLVAVEPRLVTRSSHPDLPWLFRGVLAATGTHDLLELSVPR